MTASIDIRNALHSLEDNSYQLVHLHYLHGFSLKEITRITGIPEGTVKSRLHAARSHLRHLCYNHNEYAYSVTCVSLSDHRRACYPATLQLIRAMRSEKSPICAD